MTLDEIGKKLKVTRERVRQIQKSALHKLQKKMANATAE
jgi:DNA-directed RNA polymerase sigma subunit (sigma70/sigma32)